MPNRNNRPAKKEQQKKIILVGCGGLAVEVAQYINDWNHAAALAAGKIKVAAIYSNKFDRHADICDQLGAHPIALSDINDALGVVDANFLICIGDPTVRHRYFSTLSQRGARFERLIHPTAYVADTAQIGAGAIIAPFAFIGPFARVGENCFLNVRSTVGHDVLLGRSVVLSPHSDVNGGASCGEATLLAAASVVDPSLRVGKYCKISSGAVVKKDIPDGFLVTGNPASGRQMFKIPE